MNIFCVIVGFVIVINQNNTWGWDAPADWLMRKNGANQILAPLSCLGSYPQDGYPLQQMQREMEDVSCVRAEDVENFVSVVQPRFCSPTVFSTEMMPHFCGRKTNTRML